MLLFPVLVRAEEPPAIVSSQQDIDKCTQLGRLYLEIQSQECELQTCRPPAKETPKNKKTPIRDQRAWANSRCATLYDSIFEGYKAACGVELDYDRATFEELEKLLTYYEEAYLCTPGIEHADYLHRALWRIASAQKNLNAAQIKFAADEAALATIETKLATLERRSNELSALLPPPPPTAKPKSPPQPPPPKTQKKTPKPTRTQAILNMLSLRIGGGAGIVKELYPGVVFLRPQGAAYGFGFSGSLRLGLGPKRRHFIEAGSEYIIVQRMGRPLRSPRKGGCDVPDVCGLAPAIQYLSASLGYGLRIIKNHLVAHTRIGMGLHVLVDDPGFGRRFGLVGLSVCSVWEILCLNLTARGSGSVFSSTNLTQGIATIEIDLLRIPAALRTPNKKTK